jgi:hypothetical protein
MLLAETRLKVRAPVRRCHEYPDGKVALEFSGKVAKLVRVINVRWGTGGSVEEKVSGQLVTNPEMLTS